MTKRLDIKGILRDPLLGPELQARAVAGILSRLTRTPHIMSAPYSIDVDGTEYIRADAFGFTLPPLDYDTRHKIFETMEKFGGGFCRKLAATWFAADTPNKERIETAFPDFMAQYGPGSQFWDK
jgi:hypothetical protein